MEFKKLQTKPEYSQDKKFSDRFDGFQQLILEVQKKDVPLEIVNTINTDIDAINVFSGSRNELFKEIKKRQSRIVKLLEEKLKLVPKNHYRNLWLALGMSAIGIPMGVAFGISIGNLGMLGVGLPIGMGIGVMIGSAMDKKAKESGRQLDVEVK